MRPATPIKRDIKNLRDSFDISFRRITILAAGLAILFCLIPGGQALAVKANSEPFQAVQPDGSVVKIFLFGDEYLHWNADETGYPVVLSADGKSWVYARQELGRLLPTVYLAGSVDPSSVGLSKPDVKSLMQASEKPDWLQAGSDDMEMFPPAGTMKNLVVLVNYTDLTFTSTRQQFDDLFNQTDYSADGAFGSVRDYFDEVSHGTLIVQSTVVEPVTVSQGYAYYGANNIYGYDVRPRTMVQEALAALEARGFDFTTVDGDGDGWVDGLTIIHAGGGEEYSGNDPNYIWSHQGYLSTTLIYDGIRMRPYHTEPARRGWDSTPSTWGITRIGVICHETGHFLGLPDLYDYDYDSEGVGNFCLMAGGSWNGSAGTTPSHPSAFCKEGLGWSIPSLISTGGFYALSQAETSTNLYKIRVGFAGNEYFLVENRQGVGFDSALPGPNRGLLIWHVDSNQPDNDDQTHFLVDLEEASGTQHLELNQNAGDDADYFREGNATEFTGTSVPNNISYTNEACAFDIRSVSASGAMMSFVVNGLAVTVTSPSGGEVLQVGDVHVISWTVEGGIADSIGIYLSLDSGANYDRTVATGIVGAGTYGWTVPNLPVNSARVKVVAYADGAVGGSGASGEDFTIKGYRRYVSLTGGNIYPYSLPAWAARSIQNAVNAADPGDSIMVEAGTYTSAVSIDRPVLLYGGWSPGFISRDPSLYLTKIQAGGSTVSFVSIASGSPGIEGFTITGGTGTAAILPINGVYGGGIFVYGSPAVIRDNVITNCGFTSVSGFSGGGAIACYDGMVTIEGNSIAGCRAQSGGGIYLYQAAATISGNTISGSLSNQEYSGTRNGGAVYALHSDVAMSGNVIVSNTGYREGGGIYARLSTLSMSGDSVVSNQSLTNGAGLCSDHSPVSISGGIIKGNESTGSGAGIWHKGESLDIANSLVAGNISAVIGGGIYADSTWGGWVNNTIDGNSALYAGGNVFLSAAVSLDARNNLVTNGAPNGFQATNPANIVFRYNDCFGNTPENVVTVVPDATNIAGNPEYADAALGDYQLAVFSAAIDAGDPALADPDGSRSDIGMFGGPGAATEAPDLVQNLVAEASGDTTIMLSWDPRLPGGFDYYAVYADTSAAFIPGAANFIGSAPAEESVFLDHPVAGCMYYRVNLVDDRGYAGGYSAAAVGCTSGPDTTPPVVAVLSPNGGETFAPGDTIHISWSAVDDRQVDSVSIYFSANAGADFTMIAHGEQNDALFTWMAPAVSSDSCVVRVVAFDAALLSGHDASDSLFSIDSTTGSDNPPVAAYLKQNYPNPFNPVTRIEFSIPEQTRVSLRIYDVSGRLVDILVDETRPAGVYTETWNGRDRLGNAAASGVYFCRIVAGDLVRTRKMVLLR